MAFALICERFVNWLSPSFRWSMVDAGTDGRQSLVARVEAHHSLLILRAIPLSVTFSNGLPTRRLC